ncbi:MAG: hypothetical protein ACREPN_01175 [Rudaea sp.]
MRSRRETESKVFGYTIERLNEFEDNGLPCAPRYEVLCPRTGAVLGNFADTQTAKRFIIVRELRAIRAGTQRLNQDIRVA